MGANDVCLPSSSPGFINTVLPLFTAVQDIFDYSLIVTVALQAAQNKWRRKTFLVVNIQIRLLVHSSVDSVCLFRAYAISQMWSEDVDSLWLCKASVRTDAVLAELVVWMPYRCQLCISSCCLWRKAVCVLLAHSLHRLLLFHHRKVMLRSPQSTLVWEDEMHLSVHARVSYSRTILIRKQAEQNNKSEQDRASVCLNQQAIFLLLFLLHYFKCSWEDLERDENENVIHSCLEM